MGWLTRSSRWPSLVVVLLLLASLSAARANEEVVTQPGHSTLVPSGPKGLADRAASARARSQARRAAILQQRAQAELRRELSRQRAADLTTDQQQQPAGAVRAGPRLLPPLPAVPPTTVAPTTTAAAVPAATAPAVPTESTRFLPPITLVPVSQGPVTPAAAEQPAVVPPAAPVPAAPSVTVAPAAAAVPAAAAPGVVTAGVVVPAAPAAPAAAPAPGPAAAVAAAAAAAAATAAAAGAAAAGGGPARRLLAIGAMPVPKAVTWKPPPQAAYFQYQLGEVIKVPSQVIKGVSVYGIDGFDTPASTVRHMRSLQLYPICYMSSAYEKWRPDAGDFPAAALGKPMDGWDGERWVDIRSPAIRAIAKKRMELCASKGFTAVEFDNVDVSSVNTGFPLTSSDQAAFIRYLAGTAHSMGLAYGLKNAPSMARDLVNQVDFAISEECAEFEECDLWKPFKDAGKQVFVIEYDRDSFKQLCPQAAAFGVRPILKEKNLKAKPRTPCPGAL